MPYNRQFTFTRTVKVYIRTSKLTKIFISVCPKILFNPFYIVPQTNFISAININASGLTHRRFSIIEISKPSPRFSVCNNRVEMSSPYRNCRFVVFLVEGILSFGSPKFLNKFANAVVFELLSQYLKLMNNRRLHLMLMKFSIRVYKGCLLIFCNDIN